MWKKSASYLRNGIFFLTIVGGFMPIIRAEDLTTTIKKDRAFMEDSTVTISGAAAVDTWSFPVRVDATGHEMIFKSTFNSANYYMNPSVIRGDNDFIIEASGLKIEMDAVNKRPGYALLQFGRTEGANWIINTPVVTDFSKANKPVLIYARSGLTIFKQDIKSTWGNGNRYEYGEGFHTEIGGRVVANQKVKFNFTKSGNAFVLEDGEIQLLGDVEVSMASDAQSTLVTSKGGNLYLGVEKTDRISPQFTGKKISLQGNINLAKTDGKKEAGHVYMGLTNIDSTWTGAVYRSEDSAATLKIWLQNGAIWNHRSYGVGGLEKGGSYVEALHGGINLKGAGWIRQESSGMRVRKLDGHTIIFFEHKDDGTKADDFKGGEIHITEAAPNSAIHLVTNMDGIEMLTDEGKLTVLNNLAGKLFYDNYVDGEKNLKSTARISSGLTARSFTATLATDTWGNLEFKDYNGQGKINKLERNDTNGEWGSYNDGNIIIAGGEETSIMRGARLAMTDAVTAWRDEVGTMCDRRSVLCTGAKDGVWARITRGESSQEVKLGTINTRYWLAEFGCDKALTNGWNVGAGFSYRRSNNSYTYYQELVEKNTNSGCGDITQYALGLYGTKSLKNGVNMDIGIKIGHIQNKYWVTNEVGRRFNAKYDAMFYGLIGRYGKRIYHSCFYWEPSVSMEWIHTGPKSYAGRSEDEPMTIRQDGYNSVVGRLGVEIGKERENGKYFAKLSVARDFRSKLKSLYTAADGGTKEITACLKDTWTELTLGSSWDFNPNMHIEAEVTRGLSGDYQKDWQVAAKIMLRI